MVGPQEGIKFHLRYKLMYFYVILFFCTYSWKFWGSSFSSFWGLRAFVFETPFPMAPFGILVDCSFGPFFGKMLLFVLYETLWLQINNIHAHVNDT